MEFTKKGNQIDYSFIHSLKCSFHSPDELDPRIEAEGFYRFRNILKNRLLSTQNMVRIFPYLKVFKNYDAYQMFKDLAAATVKNDTRKADFSYIFHKMRNNDEGLIYLDIKQVTFIQFLIENFNAQLTTLNYRCAYRTELSY